MKKSLLLVFFAGLASIALAEASVTNVLVRQRRPWAQKVDIDFTICGEKSDVELTATWDGQSTPVTLQVEKGLEGKAYGVQGDCHLSWDAETAGYELPLNNFRVAISVQPVSARKWLVIDLTNGSHEFLADEPVGGFNADDAYKTTKMVFRRIPSTTFTMGYSSAQIAALKRASASDWYGKMWTQHQVTLSDDYYMAIYRLTNAQCEWIGSKKQTSTGDAAKSWRMGSGNGYNSNYSYNYYRGAVADGANWPTLRYAVGPNSILGKFRALTGNRFLIDFPTDAQLENAFRCGTTTLWSHGGETDITAEGISNMVAQVCNADSCIVGTKLANAYGLYDTVGHGMELCNDQWVSSLGSSAVTDPVGPTDNESARTVKSGGWVSDTVKAGLANPAYRMGTDVTKGRDGSYGYMVARPCIHLNSVFH